MSDIDLPIFRSHVLVASSCTSTINNCLLSHTRDALLQLYGHEVLSEQSLVCTMYDYIATINTQGVLMQL